MKDPDSTREKSTENADDMSLADLLGGDSGGEENAPKRVDSRDDEPDSGMVNLAQMVADSSVEVARTPSIMPPPARDPSGVQPTYAMGTGDPSGVVQTQQMAPGAAPKKSNGMMILVVILALGLVGVMVYFMTKGGDAEDAVKAALEAERKANQDQMAMLMKQMEELKNNSTDDAAAKEAMAKLQAELDAQKAVEEGLKIKEEAAKADAEAAAAAEAAKNNEPEKTKVKASSESSKPAASSSKPKSDSEAKPASSTKPKTEKAAGGTNALDDLLGGNKKKEEDKKPAASSGGGSEVPNKPSGSDVKAAMAPVKARAQKSCAKYSTGVVQVSVTVGNNGRVTSAEPKGAFAGNEAGKCVAMQARTARFPKFSDPTFTFVYPITLQ